MKNEKQHDGEQTSLPLKTGSKPKVNLVQSASTFTVGSEQPHSIVSRERFCKDVKRRLPQRKLSNSILSLFDGGEKWETQVIHLKNVA